MIRCGSCRQEVPAGSFCIRCGARDPGHAPAHQGPAGRFAAAPQERVWSPRLISSLFPQLPRADLRVFRLGLYGGLVLIAVLGFERLLGPAVLASAVLVPLLTTLYLYDVDLYEDQSLRILGLTMGAGALAGIVVATLARVAAPPASETVVSGTAPVLLEGVLLPLLGLALILAGPLVLLRYRRFNDVLDGATFGATAAVCFAGAQTVTLGLELFAGGLRPPGDAVDWLVRLAGLAIGMPVLLMAAAGAVCAALWLRYRAPVRDRDALGLLGRPLPALLAGAVLVVAASTGEALLPLGVWLAFVLALDAVALVWLRRAIHLGLLQEAAERPVGVAVTCANCGRETLSHTFCANCGVALRALPRRVPGHDAIEPAAT